MQLLRISDKKEYLLCPDAIWAGTGNNLLPDRAIHIKNGRISQIFNPATAQNQLPAQNKKLVEIIRLPDVTLLPGFIDCHIHLSMDGRDLLQTIKEWDECPEATEIRVQDELAAYLRYGVVAARDGGDKKSIGLAAKKSIAAGRLTGPLIIATGQAIYRKEKYGSFLGPGISDIKEVAPAVQQLVDAGADQLKVVVSGLVSFKKFGMVGTPQFSLKELTYIVEAGHAHGLKVMAHASSQVAVEIAVAAGVDSVEHGYFLSDDSIKQMAEQGTAWVPTLAPLGNLVNENHIPYPGADLDVIKRTVEQHKRQLAKAAAAGVLLGIGTDAGANMVPHGISYYNELNYFREAGLDQAAVLRAATGQAARITGLDDIIGTVEPGKKPYIIGVKGNPLSSPEPLKPPVFVCLPTQP